MSLYLLAYQPHLPVNYIPGTLIALYKARITEEQQPLSGWESEKSSARAISPNDKHETGIN